MRYLTLCPAFIALLAITAGSVFAQHHHHDAGGTSPPASKTCTGAGLNCATTATPAFGSDGTLWLAWAAADKVWAAKSVDLGRTFSSAVAVTPDGLKQPLDNGPDARPKILVDKNGGLIITFATRDAHYNGRAYTSRSHDGGATFDGPTELAPNSPSQRFETAAIDADGRVFAAWIDKRNAATAKKSGAAYAGAALAFSWSEAGGSGFSPAVIARDNTCECCRIGVGFLAPGRPVVMFRNIFEGRVRDHALIAFDEPQRPGPVRRVSVDDWQTDACPHHGPGLAISAAGTIHATWFTNGTAHKGLYYANSRDVGASFSAARKLGASGRQASRPFVLAEAGKTWLVWKEFDGERTEIVGQVSSDDGANWGTPRALASSAEGSDHPLLVARSGRVYLSWLTQREGYRLIELEAGH